MRAGLSSEFFHSKSLILEDFEEAFKSRFPDGEIETVVEEVPDHPHSRFINVITFFDEEQGKELAVEELKSWWEEYIESRGYAPKFIKRTTYPRGDE